MQHYKVNTVTKRKYKSNYTYFKERNICADATQTLKS